MSESISVLIADDHPLLRSGIAAVLMAMPEITVVAEAGDGKTAVELFRQFHPRITLMDIQMPGMNGIEATREIRQIDPGALIIILTTFDGDAQVMRCMEAGASAYVLKSLARTELIDCVKSVLCGRRVQLPDVAGDLARGLQIDALSQREVEVLRLVAGGHSNLDVASKLGLREDTIKAHMKTIFMKLDARDRTHAVMIALRRGYWEA